MATQRLKSARSRSPLLKALRRVLAPVCLAALSTGCANMAAIREAESGVSAYFVGDYRGAVDRLRPVSQLTDENFVLNNCRLGSAALVDYNLDEAEAAFLRAYEVMNSVGVNDGGRSLGAALVDEKIRIWKGEPFERAMANFYLGLVYYMREDYANARAAFENALFKLRDYEQGGESDEYREMDSDFALANLMLAKTYLRLNQPDQAAKEFQRAGEIRPYLAPLADARLNAESNVLLVVEFGRGPVKATDFDGSIVGFGPTPREAGPLPEPQVIVDGRPLDLAGRDRPPVDLLALAQERRWQDIDTIRTVKSAVGTGLIAGGLYEGSRRNGDGAVALGLIAAGLLAKATSQADVRQWEMLPRTVYLLPLKLTPGEHEITVVFPDFRGLRQTWRGLVAPSKGEATYYFRLQRYNPGPFEWPPPALAGGDDRPPPPETRPPQRSMTFKPER